MNGAPVTRDTAFAAASPTRREPTSPGPTVTATPSSSPKLTPATSSARSSSGLRTSTCARDASSGTTPPNRSWTSTWLATRFDRSFRPSSTTATAVSSQEVSIPRTRVAGLTSALTVRSRGAVDDALEEPFVVGGVDVVGPHHEGVLPGLLVVALADPHRTEAEPRVHLLSPPVRHADLERYGPRSHVDGRLDQLVQQAGSDLPALVDGVDGDRRHVGLVSVADHPGVPHHVPADPGHDVAPVRGLGH